ncbi:G-type lectin S-receptor-like serine/threonine-protein kinase [Gossypium australe]|uniref:non-specific serine/threonine protein kinase n=1 Tax=Gossypium australe TaxID=47621 RepID=A0A5B6VEK5_9ROSI|nr:G-type lectin S-receptor-like serine/threonine-protein kinase [Gossypium australe]
MTILASVLYVRKMKLRNTGEEDLELPVFDFATIATAMNNFSSDNTLGQGGFSPVYKVTLIEGQEIAVKRLSKNSGQGIEEFKNEVTLIAKLQHRNLVKLFGCCIRKAERMLIYEYMPNKSLDYFIFDQTKRKLLDWRIRMHIVDGIARGVLYLHHDSRLRIINRDLKASNILLDNDMNPKISDFGLARKFGVDQIQAKTRRVVGTCGYMPPVYALSGLFSMKSDVFSFGVLVLEILSGKKSRGFSHQDHDHNLLGHAWRLWTEKRPIELIDKALGDSYDATQVLRCINVALLCVQQSPSDRPNMSLVLLMLCGESILPQPKQPGFFIQRYLPMADSISVENEICTRLLPYCKEVWGSLQASRTLALNTISPGQSIKDGQTIVSASGSFELGFFSPGNSKSRYVGIWYKKVSTGTVVWVANREASVSDASGVLSINDKGILSIMNGTKGNTSRNSAEEPIAQLLDSGNFVVKDPNDSDSENFLWQSFDYPCDTFLPGMKIGINFVTGFDRHISSWKSMEDPAPGLYSMRIDPRGLPQLVVKKGPDITSRGGSWNVGLTQRSIWNKRKNEWEVDSTSQADQCSIYDYCGSYATCSTNESPP